jgi:4-amino-4-deoxy-L-arabinose transferase-like glycosyltransferase
VVIVLVGLALRLYQIGLHGLFVDEIYSVLVATHTGDPELMQFDAARPLYFWLLNAWHTFAADESGMRILSLIFGVSNIALVYLLGKIFGGSRVGLAAAILTALSPMEIHYGQLVRMYTMGTFFVVLGTIALFLAYKKEKKTLIIAWAAARLLMVLTLPLTVLILIVDCLYVFRRRKDSKLFQCAVAGAATLMALWLPFMFALRQAHQSPYDYWRASLDVPSIFDFVTLLFNFTCTAAPLQEGGGPPVYDYLTGAFSMAFLASMGLAIAFLSTEAKMKWCCAYAMVPLGMLFCWSYIDWTILITRYSLFTAPFVFTMLAYGWQQAQSRWRSVGIGLAAVYGLGILGYINTYYANPVHEDWRPVAQFIAEHEKPGDEIVIWNYHSSYFFKYYYHGKNRITDLLIRKLGEDGKETTDLIYAAKLEFEFPQKKGQRIWVLSKQAQPGWARMYKVYTLFQKALGEKFTILQHKDMSMVDIYEVVGR